MHRIFTINYFRIVCAFVIIIFSFNNIQAQSPVADFIASDTTICIGNTVSFYNLSTGNPSSFQWTFFGATPDTSTNPNPFGIKYTAIGVYPVMLIVSDSSGSDTLIRYSYITVDSCLIPKASFIVSNNVICESNCLSYLDQSSGNPASWLWFFPGATPATSTAQSPYNVCYDTAGFYDVTLIVSNAYGTDTIFQSAYIEVYTCPRPVPYFTVSDTTPICSMSCLSFTDTSTNSPTSWFWEFPGATPDTSSLQNPTNICYDNDGVYDVTLHASNQYGSRILTKTGYITVISIPGSYITPDTTIYLGDKAYLYAGGGVTYQWLADTSLLTPDTLPDVTVAPMMTTTYSCIVTDSSGCRAVKEVTVTVLHTSRVFIANTFAPDDPYANNIVYVRGNNLQTIRLTIYDRWGEKIFETTDQNIGWDGKYRGKKCNPGVYVYNLVVSFTDVSSPYSESGNITLIR